MVEAPKFPCYPFSMKFNLLMISLLVPCLYSPLRAASVPYKLAIGTTYIGGQLHWGFARKWAFELRNLKSREEGAEGTVTAKVLGARGYYYFRAPSRARFYMGLEAASTESSTSEYYFQTKGTAFGCFTGTELYLLRRLSVGVDVGPYFLSSKVQRTPYSPGNDGDMYFVINTFMNFYFL